MLREDIKLNHINYSSKTREGRKKEKKTNYKYEKQKAGTNMIGINPTISIITLKMSDLNILIKKQR